MERRAPSPTRTQVLGKADAASHQCTTSTGAPTSRPAGTSMKTGSGVNASFRRTRASPSARTAPSMSAAPGTSSAPPKANRAPDPDAGGSVAVTALARPLCTRTLPAIAPSAVVSAANNWSPAGAAPSAGGCEVVEVQRVNGRVAPDLLALGRQRARTEGVETGGPPFPEPVRPGQGRGSLRGKGVQGQLLFRSPMWPMHSSGPRGPPHEAD